MRLSPTVKKVLLKAKTVLIIVSKPIDYDCLASGIVLRNKLAREGKDVKLVSPVVLPEYAKIFPLVDLIKVYDTKREDFERYDLIIALDSGNARQFAEVEKDTDFNFGGNSEVLHIDHHFDNNHFAKYEIWDPKASSTTEILLSAFIDIDKVTKDEATLLYAGLLGDTGNFRYQMSYKTLGFAAELLKKGADYNLIVNEYFFKHKQKAFEILALLIDKTLYNYKLGYSYAVIDVSKMCRKLRCDQDELRGGFRLYEQTFGGSIEGISITFLIKKYENKIDVKMTGNKYTNKIPLPEIGKALGGEGGGHFNFAGYDLKGDVNDVVANIEKVVRKLRKEYKQK